jgi:hypothetical protein
VAGTCIGEGGERSNDGNGGERVSGLGGRRALVNPDGAGEAVG